MCLRVLGLFCQTVSKTNEGYPRTLNSILGVLSLTSEQAKALEVLPGSRLSPHLELCCLRQSAIVSYEKASKEVQVQTGRRVSARTQQRLVQRHEFVPPMVEEPIQQCSLDGAMIRLRTPEAEASEWKEYKAVNLIESHQGMAWFKDSEGLLNWANSLPMAENVWCLGDGHDGVWSLYARIGCDAQRTEILDWFHLMENLHNVPGSNNRLKEARAFLWQGKVDEAIGLFEHCRSDEARRFRGYLERHRERIPNYEYYQSEGIPIGSGDVESLAKQINQRTKIVGASWSAKNVPQVLAHRCAYLNGNLDP